MFNMYLLLVLAGLLVAVGLVAGLYSSRLGFSHLLIFLIVGMLAGVDGPLGLPFSEFGLAFGVGNLALAIILLDGGLRTPTASLRVALWPAALLATLGVAMTTAIVAAGAMVFGFGGDWRHAALLGAIVSSTDAAAVFAQLGRSGAKLPARLTATIEIESGLNDPVAVFLTLSLITLIQNPAASALDLAWPLARQLGLGLAIGIGGGWLVAALVSRLPLRKHHDGLSALLLSASGTVVFALAAMLEGSGFLAVYLFGIVLSRRAAEVVRAALGAIDGYTWLAQAVMFLLLGLLVTPHEVLRFAWPGLLLAAMLMFIARPLAVAVCLTPLRFAWREQLLVAWVGLRGAVPIVLALYPVLADVKGSYVFFDLAFVVVLCSMLLQAPSAGWLARRLALQKDRRA